MEPSPIPPPAADTELVPRTAAARASGHCTLAFVGGAAVCVLACGSIFPAMAFLPKPWVMMPSAIITFVGFGLLVALVRKSPRVGIYYLAGLCAGLLLTGAATQLWFAATGNG